MYYSIHCIACFYAFQKRATIETWCDQYRMIGLLIECLCGCILAGIRAEAMQRANTQVIVIDATKKQVWFNGKIFIIDAIRKQLDIDASIDLSIYNSIYFSEMNVNTNVMLRATYVIQLH